jgi:hypothetical protein
VRSEALVECYKFNQRQVFRTEESPTSVFDIIDSYRAEVCPDNLSIESNLGKKFILITDKANGLVVKLKMHKTNTV